MYGIYLSYRLKWVLNIRLEWKAKHVDWILNVTREARVINKDWRISLLLFCFYIWNHNGCSSIAFDDSYISTFNGHLLMWYVITLRLYFCVCCFSKSPRKRKKRCRCSTKSRSWGRNHPLISDPMKKSSSANIHTKSSGHTSKDL